MILAMGSSSKLCQERVEVCSSMEREVKAETNAGLVTPDFCER